MHQQDVGESKPAGNAFNSDDLKEAERFFEWAISYERKGLQIAADALRDEGRKALERFMFSSSKSA